MEISADTDLSHALRALREGKVIVYPTDTVWGIGCDPRCAAAVERIYAIKRRSDSKAMLLLAASVEMVQAHVDHPLPAAAVEELRGTGRPTTVVVSGACGVAPALVAADGSAGFRVSRDPFSAALSRGLGAPLVSTSANISGAPAASCFAEISPEILDGADYVCVTRRDDTTPSRPSRIVKINPDNTITLLRP